MCRFWHEISRGVKSRVLGRPSIVLRQKFADLAQIERNKGRFTKNRVVCVPATRSRGNGPPKKWFNHRDFAYTVKLEKTDLCSFQTPDHKNARKRGELHFSLKQRVAGSYYKSKQSPYGRNSECMYKNIPFQPNFGDFASKTESDPKSKKRSHFAYIGKRHFWVSRTQVYQVHHSTRCKLPTHVVVERTHPMFALKNLAKVPKLPWEGLFRCHLAIFPWKTIK